MSTFAATNAGALLKLLYSSILAGVSVSVVFSIAILGATRSSDMRRDGRTGAATAYGALAGVGLLLAVAIVAYGLVLVVHKS
jgi:hypothetical protein